MGRVGGVGRRRRHLGSHHSSVGEHWQRPVGAVNAHRHPPEGTCSGKAPHPVCGGGGSGGGGGGGRGLWLPCLTLRRPGQPRPLRPSRGPPLRRKCPNGAARGRRPVARSHRNHGGSAAHPVRLSQPRRRARPGQALARAQAAHVAVDDGHWRAGPGRARNLRLGLPEARPGPLRLHQVHAAVLRGKGGSHGPDGKHHSPEHVARCHDLLRLGQAPLGLGREAHSRRGGHSQVTNAPRRHRAPPGALGLGNGPRHVAVKRGRRRRGAAAGPAG